MEGGTDKYEHPPGNTEGRQKKVNRGSGCFDHDL